MKRRILVVDDNPVNLKLAADVLEADGFVVFRAENAGQSLDIIHANPPDLILMDVALPDKDGLALTRELKADPATSHIHIIALTAFAMKGDEEKAREAGCDGYIAKPFDTRKLTTQVLEVISARVRRHYPPEVRSGKAAP